MNVLLINPPNFNELLGNNPVIIKEERGFNPPLGLLLIAAEVQNKTDYDIQIIDAIAEGYDYEQLGQAIERIKPDVVGITAMSFTIKDVYLTAELVHRKHPSAVVVVGGPHAYLFPKETVGLENVDYVLAGEADYEFTRLLQTLDAKGDLSKVGGLHWLDEQGGILSSDLPAEVADLNDLPFPARNLIDVDKYDSLLMPRRPVTTLFTSRGCPFKCIFCDRPHLGKKFRFRNPKSVVDEMEQCTKQGIHEFLIYDDTFTVRKDRVHSICEEINRRKLDVGFDVRAHINTIDEPLLKSLKKAGCRGIHYGVESGDERILKILQKGITLDRAREIFNLTRKTGLNTLGYFMIGCPTETEKEIGRTLKFARSLNADYVHMTILTPFPGTKLYFMGLEQAMFNAEAENIFGPEPTTSTAIELADGRIARDIWREYALAPLTEFAPPVWSENFSRDELAEMLADGYKKFYLRPSYILKRLMAVRSLHEFKRKAKAGLKVLSMKPNSPTSK